MRRGLSLVAGLLSASGAWGQIANISVVSAASFAPGLPAAGSIGTIVCTGLKVDGMVSAQGYPLPRSLAGVTVTVGGVAAPLYAVASLPTYQQINFQVPLEAQGSVVTVSQNGLQGTATPFNGGPGDFFQIPGTSFGVFQHAADYSLVTEQNPAAAGETIIGYATGLPTASPAVPDGAAAPKSPLSTAPSLALAGGSVSQLGLLIGDSGGTGISGGLSGSWWIPWSADGFSDVLFMGLAPGGAGLFQINFKLPNGPPFGNLQIAIAEAACNGGYQCEFPSGPVLTGAWVKLPER